MTAGGSEPSGGGPEFGPGGYLPERASKRARKIVLRAPLGMQWVWAAIVAGAVVLVAGVVFLARSGDAPGPPFEPVARVTEVENGEVRTLGGREVLVITEGGRPRGFDVTGLADVPAFCPASRRLESPDGVWSLTGRGLGVPSLGEFPTVVSDGALYLDPTATDVTPPSDESETPLCVG